MYVIVLQLLHWYVGFGWFQETAGCGEQGWIWGLAYTKHMPHLQVSPQASLVSAVLFQFQRWAGQSWGLQAQPRTCLQALYH